jgi:hypothetical protein
MSCPIYKSKSFMMTVYITYAEIHALSIARSLRRPMLSDSFSQSLELGYQFILMIDFYKTSMSLGASTDFLSSFILLFL